MQIWLDFGEYLVNVSTHGYFTVFSKKVPPIKFAHPRLHIYKGMIAELSGLISGVEIWYSLEMDDIILKTRDGEFDYADALEHPALRELVGVWLERNADMLREEGGRVVRMYEEMSRVLSVRDSRGRDVRIGDTVEFSGEKGRVVWIDRTESSTFVYVDFSGRLLGIPEGGFAEKAELVSPSRS